MWLAATATTDDPTALAVSLPDVKARLRIDHDDDDADLTDMIREASAYVERYCGIRLLPQTLECRCSGFSDLTRLSDGPVFSGAVQSISYIDAAGVTKVLDPSVYDLRIDGLDAAIIKKIGAAWPVAKHGELITLAIKVGYPDGVPYEIRAAILLRVGSNYERRENSTMGAWSEFDSLLVNFRRGA